MFKKFKLLLFEMFQNVYVNYGYIELVQKNYWSGSNLEGTSLPVHIL